MRFHRRVRQVSSVCDISTMEAPRERNLRVRLGALKYLSGVALSRLHDVFIASQRLFAGALQ